MSGRLERPLAPTVVHANHHSIELQWDHVRAQDRRRPEQSRLFDESGSALSGTLIYLQRREKKANGFWENIYTGSAMSYKVENLKANSQYEFRIQYKSGSHESARSDWSPILQTATALEPMTGETVFKAIAIPGTDQLENLLRILGPENRLLEKPDKNGNLPLMHACVKLDIAKVELLIRAGADVNDRIASGKTALMTAASAGFSKACLMLVENQANPHAVDRNGVSVLHHAIDSKNFESIATIVQHLEDEKSVEMNREVGIHRWTPLYRAVMHDCQKEIIELLLTNGADVHCEDKTTGTTALQMAIIRGNLNTVQLLVQHGADTKTLSKAGGKTLRQLAISTNKSDLINYVSALPGASKAQQ